MCGNSAWNHAEPTPMGRLLRSCLTAMYDPAAGRCDEAANAKHNVVSCSRAGQRSKLALLGYEQTCRRRSDLLCKIGDFH
jgi:hypothetical protein